MAAPGAFVVGKVPIDANLPLERCVCFRRRVVLVHQPPQPSSTSSSSSPWSPSPSPPSPPSPPPPPTQLTLSSTPPQHPTLPGSSPPRLHRREARQTQSSAQGKPIDRSSALPARCDDLPLLLPSTETSSLSPCPSTSTSTRILRPCVNAVCPGHTNVRADCAVPTAADLDGLLLALHAAVHAQDFRRAARLRDALATKRLHRLAALAKPRYASGLVVNCAALAAASAASRLEQTQHPHRDRAEPWTWSGCDDSYRAVLLSTADGPVGQDVYTDAKVADGEGRKVVWYRAAVDVRDCVRLGLRGGNVRLVREDWILPACAVVTGLRCADAGVRHPIVGTVFAEQLSISDDGYFYYKRKNRAETVALGPSNGVPSFVL